MNVFKKDGTVVTISSESSPEALASALGGRL